MLASQSNRPNPAGLSASYFDHGSATNVAIASRQSKRQQSSRTRVIESMAL